MPNKLSFQSAQLLGFTRDNTGGVASFSSSLTKSIIEGMEWSEIPECMTGGNLEGELAATVIELVPKDQELKRHAIDLEVTKVAKFQTIRLELEGTRSGKGHRTELRFKAWFSDLKGARKLEEYILTAGKSTVTVSYQKQAVQTDLPIASEEQRQATLPASDNIQ